MNYSGVIYVDGGHNKVTGSVAWGCVMGYAPNLIDLLDFCQDYCTDIVTKMEDLPVGRRRVLVSDFSDVKSQQNNGAEMLAMLIGLRIAVHNRNVFHEIRSDSQLIVSFWSKKLNDKPGMDSRKKKFILEMIELRKQFESTGGKIVKISGDDNVADLGFHR